MNIKIIGYIELGVICSILVGSILFGIKKRSYLFGKEENNAKITQNKAYAKLLIPTTVAIAIFAFWCLLDISGYKDLDRYKENLIFAQFFLLVFIVSAYMFFYSVNWEIFLYEDRFTFTNGFGVKRSYYYDELIVKKLSAGYAYFRKGHWLFNVAFIQPNHEALTIALNTFKGKQTYALSMKQWYIDVEALRREEREWLKTASDNDKTLYKGLIEKLKKDDMDVYIADYIVGVKDKDIFPIFEDILLSWEDKKMQAITAYIIGNKENKKAYCIILQAYLCLSWEEKKRYASLYDKAIGSTITKEVLMADPGWLSDWHTAFNLPKTMRKIAKWELPVVNGIWIGILKQKNTYDREYYDLEEAKATLLPLVKRRVKD